jgi:SAM-dependent methyltransferase
MRSRVPGDAEAAHKPVRAGEEAYSALLSREADNWATPTLDMEVSESLVPVRLQRSVNELLTGRPELHWFDDLTARGPFTRAAAFGATAGYLEERWQRRRTSERLDIYEISAGVIDKTRRRLSDQNLLDGVHFCEHDLNTGALPADTYDVIWSGSAIHHLVELEHVCREVERALKPGGLFAFYEYVGENRIQFDPLRLRLATDVVADLPDVLWRSERAVRSPSLDVISPFEAVRAEDIRDVAWAQFDVVHWAEAGVLAVPLFYAVDMLALDANRPDILERLIDADRRELAAGRLRGCLAYGVFRSRAGAPST